MAKSIRSKWRQKMRNEKRKKTAPKELARLLKCVGEGVQAGKDVEMQELVTVKDGKQLVEKKKADDEAMEASSVSKYNHKTLMDENGHYPGWVTKKRIKKLKAVRKASKKKGKNKNMKW